MEYGSYDPLYFSVNVPHFGEDDLLDAASVERFVRTHPDTDAQVTRAIRGVTLLHEVRHFHDCLGTMAGLSMFRARISRLRAFGRMIERLHKESIPLKLPLAEWKDDPGCPDYVQEFMRRISGGAYLDAAFAGRYAGHREAGRRTEASVDVQFGKMTLPAFPMHVGARTIDHLDAAGPQSEFTEFAPIGFEQLIEGNAQAMQRTYLESSWPTEVAERAWQHMTTGIATREQLDSDPFASITRLPYNTTDLMLSRHLLNAWGMRGFPRAWLTQLSDHSLMLGNCLPYGVTDTFSPPGGVFVTSMYRLDWKEAQASGGRLDLPDTRSMARGMLDAIRASPRPESFLPASSMDDMLSYIEAYVHHCVSAQIFERRIAEGSAVLDDLAGYATNFTRLPMPPMVVRRAHISPLSDLPEDFALVWSRYAMFGEIVRQLLAGGPVIACPRATSTVPALRFVNYTYGENDDCTQRIAANDCQPWHSARRVAVPNCYFRSMLRSLRLIPGPLTAANDS